MALVNPNFAEEMERFGEDTALECFNCGTCAAICPLIYEHFPRKMIRYLQLGAKDRIMENAQELWRCLHCGLCTQTCPRAETLRCRQLEEVLKCTIQKILLI